MNWYIINIKIINEKEKYWFIYTINKNISLIKNIIYEYNLIKIKIIKQIMMINNQRE